MVTGTLNKYRRVKIQWFSRESKELVTGTLNKYKLDFRRVKTNLKDGSGKIIIV